MPRGGKRLGSGQDPGHRFEKRLSHREAAPQPQERPQEPPNPSAPTVTPRKASGVSVASNDPKLLIVAAYAAKGLPWEEIERLSGRAVETIHAWRRAYPEVFEAAINKTLAAINPHAAFMPYVPEAIRTQVTIMTEDRYKAADRLHASDTVLAYALDKPRTPEQRDSAPVSVTINVGAIPAGDEGREVIEARFREINVNQRQLQSPSESDSESETRS